MAYEPTDPGSRSGRLTSGSEWRHLERAGSFLVAREAQHCLTLGICSDLQASHEAAAPQPLFGVVTTRDRVVMTVLWTPPWQAVLSTTGQSPRFC